MRDVHSSRDVAIPKVVKSAKSSSFAPKYIKTNNNVVLMFTPVFEL